MPFLKNRVFSYWNVKRDSKIHSCFFIVTCWFCATSHADQIPVKNAFTWNFGFTRQTDSNFFRLSDSANTLLTLGTNSRREDIDIISAGLIFEKQLSLQKLLFKADFIDYKHQNFGNLSFNAFNYLSAVSWSLSPSIRGSISSERIQSLNSYADFRLYAIRNVRTTITTRLDGEADVGSATKLTYGFDQTKRMNEVVEVNDGDRENKGSSLGLRYVFSSGSSGSYRYRQGQGESNSGLFTNGFFENQSNRFEDRLQELLFSWLVTTKTSLNGRLGYLSRKYPDVLQRNFNGPIGDIIIQWNATAKTSISASVRRDLINYQDAVSNYVSSNRVTIKPIWRATSKISVLTNFEYGHRSFVSAPAFRTGFFQGDRNDDYRLFSFGIEWQPVKSTTIALAFQKINNTSNFFGYDYANKSGNLSARFNF